MQKIRLSIVEIKLTQPHQRPSLAAKTYLAFTYFDHYAILFLGTRKIKAQNLFDRSKNQLEAINFKYKKPSKFSMQCETRWATLGKLF